MRSRMSALLVALVLTGIVAGCGGDQTTEDAAAAANKAAGPVAAGQGLDAAGHMHPGPDDRCPVCAMTTHDKKFASAIELDDGRNYYFCGTGCLMKSWLHPEVYLAAGEAGVTRAVTTEYFTGEHVDATTVTFVAGSDIVGPMGPMIVPLADAAAVARFQERHGGKITFTLPELDDAKWESMTGKKALPDAKH